MLYILLEPAVAGPLMNEGAEYGLDSEAKE